MQVLKLKPHLKTSDISRKLSSNTTGRFTSYWQIILSVSFNPGKKAEEYATFLGVPKSKIYKIVELYNKGGASFTEKLKWGGRRKETAHLSYEAEAKMMEGLRIKAKEGKVLTAKNIHTVIEKTVGQAVSDDYIWDLFKRHNWKKKMLRPQHPKHNKQAQEEFKKNFPISWQPKQ